MESWREARRAVERCRKRKDEVKKYVMLKRKEKRRRWKRREGIVERWRKRKEGCERV